MDLSEIRCKDCVYYAGLYIHPWSQCPDELKRSREGHTCLLTCDGDFMRNDPDPIWVDVTIGKEDGIGCECFTDKETHKLIIKVKRKENE